MKSILTLALILITAQALIAGPWYSHNLGIKAGDRVTNSVPLEERVYVFLRTFPSSEKRDEHIPIKVFRGKDVLTISAILKSVTGAYPKEYPKKRFVVVYRADKGHEAAYQESVDKASKADFKIQPRDVVWIGYSTQ